MDTKKPTLYVETTIPSYATARDSLDLLKLHRQVITRAFWRDERHRFRLCTSEAVRIECNEGDPDAARRRVEFLNGIEEYTVTEKEKNLAAVYQKLLRIPEASAVDCTHLAVCALCRVDYLLTWNCAHLGEVAQEQTRIYNDKNGLWTPRMVTPETIVRFLQEDL
jgi:hypothetical protein